MGRWRTSTALAAALGLVASAAGGSDGLVADTAGGSDGLVADTAGGSDGLAFARRGEPVARLAPEALDAAAEARSLSVFEPYEGREVEFLAWPLAALLDSVYGRAWREEDEILFRCRDGYQPSVPVARFLAHDAYLAFARPGAPDFGIDKLESGRRQRISLAPYYVVWDNLRDEALRRDHDYGWPYQVVGLELIDAAERFPAMAPPPAADAAVSQGFRDFRVHCSRCHALNGAGGAVGPELNDRPEPVGRRDPAWLRRWIGDPAAFNATARMPALNPHLPDRAETIDRIVAYLQAMAAAP